MFSYSELSEVVAATTLSDDLHDARQALTEARFGESIHVAPDSAGRLSNLIDAVLVSFPDWAADEGIELAQQAGQAAEFLALARTGDEARRIRMRAALLYELAAMPSMAAAVISDEDGPEFLVDFFKRRGPFRSLAEEIDPRPVARNDVHISDQGFLRVAICEDALELAQYEHDPGADFSRHTEAFKMMARNLELDLSLTDVAAFETVVTRRAARATHAHTPHALLDQLRSISFPAELWRGQAQALDAGLLDRSFDAWGFASPTGTGKTFIARLLALECVSRNPSNRVLYIVPTKALVSQVTWDLRKALEPVEIEVAAVAPHLTELDESEYAQIAAASVLVLTPEKADLLLRIGADFLSDVELVVVDEAHHIEDGTRGVLLELYLARLRSTLATSARYVLLSAVAPNISEITSWMGRNPGGALIGQRSTRMKVGVYDVKREGKYNRGILEYTDGTRLRLVERKVARSQRGKLVQLALRVASAGPLLIVAQGKGTAQTLARMLRDKLIEEDSQAAVATRGRHATPELQRLDSRLEREMYADVELRELIRWGIAYHHAGMPPRVREAVEAAISAGDIRYVVATTTLADGVNFPFSTVIVQSLVTRAPSFELGKRMSYRLFTPRKFWNIAGRAGRPGYDHEGQVILFAPSLGLEHVNATIEPYLRPDIEHIPPVTSALAVGLSTIRRDVANGEVTLANLDAPELDPSVSRATQGVVNLIRVGLAHARATGGAAGPDYFGSTYAASVMSGEDLAFSKQVVAQQQAVLDRYLAEPGAPPVELVAELGLSIDTLSRLQQYIRSHDDGQIAALTKLMYGPSINLRQLRYLVSRVLSNMAELEGGRLSGWYSNTVGDWCQGKPFTDITGTRTEKSIEDLIRVMYSSIQYMLPWGLYATDRFAQEEAASRGIEYGREINQLAYLVSAGVPNWPAFALTVEGFERVDAARLSRPYLNSGAGDETDIVSWVVAQHDRQLAQYVRGSDRRSLDFDFTRLVSDLRSRRPRSDASSS